MSSVTLGSGAYALVGVIDALRGSERPMSTRKLSLVTHASVAEVEGVIARLKQAQQLLVYTVKDREFYDITGEIA